jgi:hypothetical protein
MGLVVVGCSRVDEATGSEQEAVKQDDDVLVADSFVAGQTGDWFLETDEFGSTTIADESLVIDIHEPDTIQFSTLRQERFEDFILEVDARQLAGSPENSLGVLFRMVSPEEFYRFEITSEGRYMIERRQASGEWTRFLSDWTPSEIINRELEGTNHIMVVANGSQMAFYVNGELLEELEDSAYPAGSIALDAGTFGEGRTTVAFDNLVIQRP